MGIKTLFNAKIKECKAQKPLLPAKSTSLLGKFHVSRNSLMSKSTRVRQNQIIPYVANPRLRI
jgi:hypothetical protein